MEELVNTVPAIRLVHAEPSLPCSRLDQLPQIAEEIPRLGHADCLVETGPRGRDEREIERGHLLSDGICWVSRASSEGGQTGRVEVAVKAVVEEGHIEVHNVPVDQWTRVGDPMADDLVHGPGSQDVSRWSTHATRTDVQTLRGKWW